MSTHTIVRASVGPVRGAREADVLRFSGVPFATAPRFGRPREVAWEGTFDATSWGPAPWQPLPAFDEPGAPLGEDCLNAAIWAPADATTPLPVLVWVYGGGFEHGSNASPLTRGDLLAAGGEMIVVALNYRIGAFGWAELAHLGGPLADASNLGLRDLIAGLSWVQRNIAAFGGDPGQVTVMGESAGSFALCALLGAPEASPLFTSLAAFSGCTSRIVPIENARRLGEAILDELGADPMSAEPSQWIAAQRRASPKELGLRNSANAYTLGVVDDRGQVDALLQSHPLDAVRRGAWGARRMLVGTTRDEAAHFPVSGDHDAASLARDIAAWTSSPRAAEIAADYLADEPELMTNHRRVLTDWVYRLPSVRLADAVTAAGGRAYLSTVGRVDGAPAAHGVDVPGLFSRSLPDDSPAAAARAAEITRAVRCFVTDEMPWEPTRGEAGTIAHSFGEASYDAGADYARVRDRWSGVARP